jgi:hypothetical protein
MQAVVPLQYRPRMRRRPSRAVYRRRRLAALLCVVALAALAWLGLHRLIGTSSGAPLSTAGRPVSTLHTELVAHVRAIVQPGDTLWSIARRARPTGDIRPVVAQLEATRHGRALQVGETIEVPRSR